MAKAYLSKDELKVILNLIDKEIQWVGACEAEHWKDWDKDEIRELKFDREMLINISKRLEKAGLYWKIKKGQYMRTINDQDHYILEV